jgi:hypothetical protein
LDAAMNKKCTMLSRHECMVQEVVSWIP